MPSRLSRTHVAILRRGTDCHVRAKAGSDPISQGEVWEEGAGIDVGRLDTIASRILGLISENNLRRKVETARSDLVSLGKELFETAFCDRIGDLLRKSESEFLILELNGESLGVPWELAHDGADFLGRRFSVGRKASEWEPQKAHAPLRSIDNRCTLILSDPSGDLATATTEGEYLSELLSRELDQEVVWLNGQVECGALKEWLPRADIFHFCGHFEEAAEAEMGWKLADRKFTPEDLRESFGKNQAPPLLLFNNACHTGPAAEAGQDCDENAFAGALLKMGCLHYIGAYLKVLDRQASEFARIFYRRALEGGAVGTALKQARIEFCSDHSPDHLTWAQYVLYGDPTTGLLGKTALFPEVHTIVFGDCDLDQESVRETLSAFELSEMVLGKNGSVAILFPRPSEAVRFALLLEMRFRANGAGREGSLPRLAVAGGELLVERSEETGKALTIRGYPCDIGLALLGLSEAGQILTTRQAHENARAMLRSREIPGAGQIAWVDHGSYVFESLEDPLEVCEVGEEDSGAPLRPPRDTTVSHRSITPDQEPVLGWRPSLDSEIPNRPEWVLTEKLGAGGFGEVWRARNRGTAETRVFKFCFRADRVRSLKREVTLFRILRDRLGRHPHIVQVHDAFFEEPPFFISMEDVQGLDLAKWCHLYCKDERVDEAVRLEIVAKVADALQAAHDAGVIHRDVKPSNILIEGTPDDLENLNIKLTDFGIGRLESKQSLVDITALGFSETYRPTELSTGSGSRLYMAPELLVGRESSIRSDIYSLGMVLYQVLLRDCDRPLTVDWERDIRDPILLEDLRGCLSGEALDRFSSAEELANRLRSVKARREIRKRQEERLRIEARRKRWTLVSSSIAAIAVMISIALGIGLNQARKAEIREREERETAERNLYFSQIGEIERAVEDRNASRARRLLYQIPERFRGWEWGYLTKLSNTDRLTFAARERDVVAMEVDPQGRLLALGHEGGKVSLHDLDSGESLWTGDKVESLPLAMAFDSRSTLLAVSTSHRIVLWDLESKNRVQSFHSPTGYYGALRFSPIEQLLSAADPTGKILLYDLTSDSTRVFDSGHAGPAHDFDFSPDGQWIVTGGEDSFVQAIDTRTGRVDKRTQLPGGSVTCVEIDPSGEWALALAGQSIRFVRLEDFEIHSRDYQILQRECAAGLDLGPGGQLLACSSEDGRVEFVDLVSMNRRNEGGNRGGPRSIRITPDGRYAITIDEDGSVRQRYLNEWEARPTRLAGLSGWTKDMLFTRDGGILYSCVENGQLLACDALSGERLASVELGEPLNALALSPDEQSVAVGTSKGEILFCESSDLNLQRRIQVHSGPVNALVFLPGGEQIASVGADRVLNLLSVKTGNKLATIEAVGPWALALSTDGNRLLVGDNVNRILELDSRSLKLEKTYEGHSSLVREIAVFPSGKRFASIEQAGGINVWDCGTGAMLQRQKTTIHLAYNLMVDPDEKRIWTSNEIWDLDGFRPLLQLPAGKSALSPDGLRLAVERGGNLIDIHHSFPWKNQYLGGDEQSPLEERIELYKRKILYSRQAPAVREVPFQPHEEKRVDMSVGRIVFRNAQASYTTGLLMNYPQTTNQINARSHSIGWVSEFGIPRIGVRNSEVLRFKGPAPDVGLVVYPDGFHAKGAPLESYSLILDVHIPGESLGRKVALFNACEGKSDPAEWVLSATGGLGTEGAYHGLYERGTWARLACVVELGEVSCVRLYLNGEPTGLLNLPADAKDRWKIAYPPESARFHLFSGSDCEPATCYLSSLQFRSYAMAQEEVAQLGGPSAEGIPVEVKKDSLAGR